MRNATSLGLSPISMFRPWQVTSLFIVASALFLRLRARPTRSVRAYFLAASCTVVCLCPFDPIDIWIGFSLIAWVLLFPLWLRFAQLFPDDVALEGRWQHVWPWLFAAHGAFEALYNVAGWFTIGDIGIGATAFLGLAALLAVATRNYRRGDAIARRQMRWVLFGFYCAGLPLVVASTVVAFDLRLAGLFFASFWAFPLFPIALVISVVRFNLFDVDRLLSATASYNIVLVFLGAGVLVLVPRLAEAASGLLGVDPGAGQVALSLLLACVVVPAHRRLRPQIDRLFFKERYALDHGIAELLPALSRCQDVRALMERAGEGLNRLLRPDACVVYARVEDSYAAVFVKGRAVPPGFGAASPLIASLHERRVPLALGGAGRRPDAAPVGPFDRAALETLQAEVVVPVHRGDELAAFVCLGPQQSGDVYTSTDISHLTVVSEKVSTELRRFDQEQTVREAREMQESLRRYVPGAIADQLSSGVELASGEREVTVLFVDIRGYMSFSESRPAAEIFSTVNRYTENVSQIVQKHAGSVVEFNGDGLMAVFGAPRELAHKERAAVEAGVAIVDAVGSLPIEDAANSASGTTKLSVGVGIATGEAFVGNIQAVDRMIWSAIGNTTNLAARLQSLTRNLDAALVIDHATWQRAMPAAAAFEKRPEVSIRGRRESQDLYVLAMPTPS